MELALFFQPTRPDGLLLYTGKREKGLYSGGDFLSLALVDGRVRLAFNLGSGLANLSSPARVRLGGWHELHIKRSLRKASLHLDALPAVVGEAPPPWDKLNVEGEPVMIGGVRESESLPPALPELGAGFHGRIQKLIINGFSHTNLLASAVLASGVSRYEGPPCSQGYCGNGGTCLGHLDTANCRCPPGFRGNRCEESTARFEPSRTQTSHFHYRAASRCE